MRAILFAWVWVGMISSFSFIPKAFADSCKPECGQAVCQCVQCKNEKIGYCVQASEDWIKKNVKIKTTENELKSCHETKVQTKIEEATHERKTTIQCDAVASLKIKRGPASIPKPSAATKGLIH